MNTNEPLDSSQDTTTLTAFTDFMGSLQKLFKIGVYYPSGHAILDKAMDQFMAQLEDLAGENPDIIFMNYTDGLTLEDVKLNPKIPFVNEFTELLTALSISEISIHRQITRSDVNTFIQSMLMMKAKIKHTKKFKHFDFAVFPPSINVQQKEFVTAKAALDPSGKGGEATSNLFSFVESLAKLGLNNQEIEQCKELIESLPEHLTVASKETQNLPTASWDDVAQLLLRSIKTKSEDSSVGSAYQHNINALASILEKFERETRDKKSREAINLLVSMIKRTIPGEEEDKHQVEKRSFPMMADISVEKLQKITDKYKLSTENLSKIPDIEDDNMMLSIIFHLAKSNQPPHNQLRIQLLLREILTRKVSEKKWSIISNGLFEIMKDGVGARITFIVRNLVDALRNSKFDTSLTLFFHTSQLCSQKDMRLLLWPYLVNELLVQGNKEDPTTYLQLCSFASTLSIEEMNQCKPQLERLESFQNTLIATDIFIGVSRKAFPLFAFLLKTDIERYIGERIIGGFKRNPTDWLIEGLAPLLNMEDQSHKLFLYSYLRQSPLHQLPQSLQKIAADIMVKEITDLPSGRREESWVLKSILALGILNTPETIALLNTIITAKKMLLIPEWGAEQRKVAEQALTAKKPVL